MNATRLRVLCGEPQNYSQQGLDAVRAFAELDAEELDQAAFEARASEYDVLMVRLQLRVTAALLDAAPRVSLILTPTTGLNHIDLEAAERHDVQVFHLRGETEFLRTITSTAEHTWGLLLALIRNTTSAFESVRQGVWTQRPFRGRELKGKTLGLVGYGRLGSIVARYAQAFDMRVVVYDPYVEVLPSGLERADRLEDLAAQSHVLTLHAPLNETTTGLIGARVLERLPEGAFVVNTARGELIDEGTVLKLLEVGHLSGYAADVVQEEHCIRAEGHPLIEYAQTHGNVLLTPHIGGAAWEAIEATDLFIIEKARTWWKQVRVPSKSHA